MIVPNLNFHPPSTYRVELFRLGLDHLLIASTDFSKYLVC